MSALIFLMLTLIYFFLILKSFSMPAIKCERHEWALELDSEFKETRFVCLKCGLTPKE